MNAMLQLPPLSLYIHYPWCVRKCPYCDFNSHEVTDSLSEQAYISAVLEDLKADLTLAQGRPIQSIFLGGGTPSLMQPESVQKLLEAVEKQLGFAEEIEITLEANPGTVDQSHFAGFRQAGINRLSMGIQSFNDRHLKTLGRIHSSKQAEEAIVAASEAGFTNVNLDLMFGLPGQTLEEARQDLHQALFFQPAHLSWYELTIEPNTVFYSRPPVMPGDDLQIEIMEMGQGLLSQNGYGRYEVSAYSRESKRSRHNLNYWQFGDYLGIGAGAHGKITHIDEGGLVQVRRLSKRRQPDNYIKSVEKIAEQRLVDSDDLPLEFMMNGLRLTEGVELALYTRRTGQSLSEIEEAVARLVERGLLKPESKGEAGKLVPTPKGLMLLNEVITGFSC